MAAPAGVDRASAADLMQLAAGHGRAAGHIGAILMRGRPYWADDPAFDADQHIRQVRCPPPGDERTLLDLVAAQLGEPLPPSRPLWSAMFVTGLADGGTALLVIMDHVLADGIAGLAVLADG